MHEHAPPQRRSEEELWKIKQYNIIRKPGLDVLEHMAVFSSDDQSDSPRITYADVSTIPESWQTAIAEREPADITPEVEHAAHIATIALTIEMARQIAASRHNDNTNLVRGSNSLRLAALGEFIKLQAGVIEDLAEDNPENFAAAVALVNQADRDRDAEPFLQLEENLDPEATNIQVARECKALLSGAVNKVDSDIRRQREYS